MTGCFVTSTTSCAKAGAPASSNVTTRPGILRMVYPLSYTLRRFHMPDASLTKMSLLIVGYGNVARRFVTLLEESRASLTARGINPVVIGVATRHHGSLVEPTGLRAEQLTGTLTGPNLEAGTAFIADAFARVPAGVTRVLIETTTLNVES